MEITKKIDIVIEDLKNIKRHIDREEICKHPIKERDMDGQCNKCGKIFYG